MAENQHQADSSDAGEAPSVTATTQQAQSDSTTIEALDANNLEADYKKPEAKSSEEQRENEELTVSTTNEVESSANKVEASIDGVESTANEVEPSTNEDESSKTNVETPTEFSDQQVADASTDFPEEQDQQAYLEPILVAMELGQEILQSNNGGDDQTTEECKSSEIAMEIDQPDTAAVSQSDVTTEAPAGVVTITHEQLASLFANSSAATAGGNVIVTSLPDGTNQTGLSIATILQDVVSGIQSGSTTSGNTATIQADTSGGAYYLVTQGGTIPIVMPQNGTGNGVASMSLVQTTNADGETFVTVNQDALPEGVDVMAPAVQSDAQGDHGGDTSGMTDGDGIGESDHELATAAAAVENDKGDLHEAMTAPPVPIVTSGTGKRRLSNGPRVCEQCNKAFKYPSDLKKHLQIHTDIKKFKCEECNRFFRRLHQLIVHQRIHTGEKPYICKHCGTAFRHDSTLTMHVRTRHEHKRPFKCDYCGHTFGRLSHLRKHMKKVCGPNKPEKQASMVIQCKFCEEIFTTKGELKKHLMTCVKKECKPKEPGQVALHVCNICNKDFASPYNVRRHQLTHSDDRPYECEYCSKSFKEKSSLTKHVKRVHLEKEKDDSCELMVSISADDQQFEVVSVPASDEALLASTSAVSSNNENDGETETVDPSTLVHVAASVMVEELLHGDDQVEEAPCTPVTGTDTTPQQAIFMTAESCKSDGQTHETDSYNGQLVPRETVSCLAEPEMSTNEDLLQEVPETAREVSSAQYGEDQHAKNNIVEEASVGEHVQSMEINNAGEVVKSNDSQEESTE